MTQATTQQVAQFLTDYGWHYETRQDGLLVTGFQGTNGSFRLFVQVEGPWLVLVIVPFVPRPTPECHDRFCAYLARLNYRMNLAKLALDNDGDVTLLAEVRADDLRFEDLAAALDVLCFYADEHYQPLAHLAADPRYEPPEDRTGTEVGA